jgi:hypothetical protein
VYPWLGCRDINNGGRIDDVITINGGRAHIRRDETANANQWLTQTLTIALWLTRRQAAKYLQ